MTAYVCWKCGTTLPEAKIAFRAICDKCQSYLHCCKNCKNYKPGLPNDCHIPGTEYVADRESFNYCEDFVLKGDGPPPRIDPDDVAKRLFK